MFGVISELWNSPDFNPVAPVSDCHFDFEISIVCSYDQVEALSPATPQKVEDIFVSMRSDLLRIITKWEQSGQGEGGRDVEEEYQEGSFYGMPSSSLTGVNDSCESIGCLAGRPSRALQSRAVFLLNGRPSYLLYVWEVADTHQLFQSSLQRPNNSIAASDVSFAAVSTSAPSSQRRRSRHGPQRRQNCKAVSVLH